MDKALYILAGYDDATEAHLSALQNSLYERGFSGTHTRGLPQHITLGSFPTDREDEVISLLKRTADEISPFEVTFNHAGIFGGSKVLFIAPDTCPALLSLKERFGSSYNWTPHTTMLIDEPDVIYRALPVVMEGFSAFSGRVTSLHLYEFFPTRYITTVYLKTES